MHDCLKSIFLFSKPSFLLLTFIFRAFDQIFWHTANEQRHFTLSKVLFFSLVVCVSLSQLIMQLFYLLNTVALCKVFHSLHQTVSTLSKAGFDMMSFMLCCAAYCTVGWYLCWICGCTKHALAALAPNMTHSKLLVRFSSRPLRISPFLFNWTVKCKWG